MRRLNRLPLSPAAVAFLEKRSAAVGATADPKAEIRRLWRYRNNRTFREIRAALKQMASGICRCKTRVGESERQLGQHERDCGCGECLDA